ncbi:MAG TPA: PEGA domain-containing protein, partial [Myxococcaceae bacterium]
SGERIPGALGTVVKRCLAKNPEDRYQSLRDLARVLEVAAQEPVRQGPSRWMVAASALGVLALGTGVMGVRGMLHRPEAAPVVTGKVVRDAAPSVPATTPTTPGVAVAEATPVADQVPLTVVSEPPGARVVELLSGKTLGTTPLSSVLPRSTAPSRLRLEHAGRRTTEVEVVPDAELEVHVTLPRTGKAPAPVSAKIARKPKHPDPFKL